MSLLELIDWIPDCNDETEIVEKIWSLCNRHGKQVFDAMKRMRNIHDRFTPTDRGRFVTQVDL